MNKTEEKRISSPEEDEILALERQLAEKKAALLEKEKTPEKKTEIWQSPEEEAISPSPAPIPSAALPVSQPALPSDSPEAQAQVKALCDLAFEKGINAAIEAAKNLNNAYILDELHDTLIDKLYEQLISQGKLKKM